MVSPAGTYRVVIRLVLVRLDGAHHRLVHVLHSIHSLLQLLVLFWKLSEIVGMTETLARLLVLPLLALRGRTSVPKRSEIFWPNGCTLAVKFLIWSMIAKRQAHRAPPLAAAGHLASTSCRVGARGPAVNGPRPSTARGRRSSGGLRSPSNVGSGALSAGTQAGAMQYQQDEKVLCFHGPLIYQAKVGASQCILTLDPHGRGMERR